MLAFLVAEIAKRWLCAPIPFLYVCTYELRATKNWDMVHGVVWKGTETPIVKDAQHKGNTTMETARQWPSGGQTEDFQRSNS